MASGFAVLLIFLATYVFIIICIIAVFFGTIFKDLMNWALSSLNFNSIATNASASNKAAFKKFKKKITNFLNCISLFGKPPKSSATTTSQLYGDFFKYVGLKIIAVLIQSFLGVYALWMCKVAQTNILPSDFRGAPYTDLPPIIDPIITQVNFFKLNGDDYSTKLFFQYLYMPDESANNSKQINSQFSILNKLREINESPTISGTTMYFIYLFENLFCLNFSMINIFFSFFNSFYEWVLVLFGSYLILFTFVVNILISNIVFIYIFFAGIFAWIWKLNKPTVVSENGEQLLKPNFIQNWVYITLFSMPLTWVATFIETVFLLNCFLPFLILGNMFVFPIITIYVILSIFFIVARISEGNKTGENYSFLTLYVNKMRYMITPIFIIMSIYVIIAAKTYLGNTEFKAAIVAVIIVLIVLMNITITNVNDFGTKDTKPYNYIQAEKRTQFKLSSTVLWAITGAKTSGDLAINIANQIDRIQTYDNHVEEVKGNPLPYPDLRQRQEQLRLEQEQQQKQQQGQSGGKKIFDGVYQSDNLIEKMKALNSKIRKNITISIMPM